jgi:hypothetical protein
LKFLNLLALLLNLLLNLLGLLLNLLDLLLDLLDLRLELLGRILPCSQQSHDQELEGTGCPSHLPRLVRERASYA